MMAMVVVVIEIKAAVVEGSTFNLQGFLNFLKVVDLVETLLKAMDVLLSMVDRGTYVSSQRTE